jgi:SAM-dependent methyltransferase
MPDNFHARYREFIDEFVPDEGRILKTDCFNEANGGDIHLEGISVSPDRLTYLELDEDTVVRARKRFPERDFQQGDIRDMPFDNEEFGGVMDLSTIDHIPPQDIAKAIAEYYRILPFGGRLLLVSWCSYERKDEPQNWGGPQYFHDEGDIRRALDDVGFCTHHSKVIYDTGEIYLLELVTDKI